MPEPLKALIARLPTVADSPNGIGAEERRLAVAIQAFGAAAIPFLMAYLKHSRADVRKLAAFTLGNIKGLNETHLPTLIRADHQEKRLGVCVAIARLGTPRAVAYLADEFRKRSNANSAVNPALSYAFETLSVKGVPTLCRLLRDSRPDEESLRGDIYRVFQQLDGVTQQTAVAPLLVVAEKDTLPLANRKMAIRIVGNLTAARRSAVRPMLRLAQRKPMLRKILENAIVATNEPEAVPVLVRWLHDPNTNHVLVLQNVGKLQKNGRAACPEVVRWLGSTDWDARREAAQALGFIGDPQTAPLLVPLLENTEDWRLVWAASESLGRLGFAPAREALLRVANAHWFPPVRDTAKLALHHSESRLPYPALSERQHELFPLARYGTAFAKHYSDDQNEPPNSAGQTLPVSGGKLVGTDDWEWGGALTFVSDRASAKRLLSKNTRAVARFGSQIIAVTGLAHIYTNEGDLFQVVQNEKGEWSAVRWRVLPGAPQWAQVRQEASGPVLHVACSRGVVDVTPEGVMRWVPWVSS